MRTGKHKKRILLRTYNAIVLLMLVIAASSDAQTTEQDAPEYNNELLQHIRATSRSIPGELPTNINYLKYAESIRKWSDVIEGGTSDPYTMARTAFQVEYPDGWVMIDAGMDRQVHHFFEKERVQPFDEAKAKQVKQAVESAKLIVITHEHGDHVANVIRTDNVAIMRKTILTKDQIIALINKPQMPEIKLEEVRSEQYIVTDFASVLPVAPGMVLVKAPGHTIGEIMIYTRLENGKEYIFTGDVVWTLKGITDRKQKPESERKRIGENQTLLEQQLSWLNDLMNKERIIMLVSHDDIALGKLAGQGLIRTNWKSIR
jgi:glyoxylase-like metal-dependent hydrolase (beta-lactamase superfamily II)